MSIINEKVREIMDASEWIAIATTGEGDAHLVGTWKDYTVKLGSDDNFIYIPVGGLFETENNLALNNSAKLMYASKSVAGQYSPGNGCLIKGTGEILIDGEKANRTKEIFPWARGVFVVKIESCQELL